MHLSLSYKLILFFSATIILVVAITASYSFREMDQLLEEQIRKDLTAIAEGTEGQVFMFFEKNKNQIVNWSSDNNIRDGFEKIIGGDGSAGINELTAYLNKNKLATDPQVLITDIFDRNGKVIISTNKDRIGHIEPVDELNEEYKFDLASRASFGTAFVSTPRIEEGEAGHEKDEVLWHVSTPLVSSKTEEAIGVMVNHISGREMNNILSGKWQVEEGALSGQEFIIGQKTAEMFLVGGDGFMITPSRFVENSIFNQRIDNPATRACFDEKLEYNGSYVGYLGHSVEVATMCFVDHNMVLLTEVGTDEVFGPIMSVRNNIGLVGILILLIGAAGMYVFSHFFLRDIKAIRYASREVMKNNYHVRVAVKSKDEVGDLAEAFNAMLDNVERSQKEVDEYNKKLKNAYVELEKSAGLLEGKIKERTKELEDIKATLELRVHEKTVELEKRLKDLEKFKALTIGRELRMIELKEELDEMKNKVEGK